jgi:hypothetical protein
MGKLTSIFSKHPVGRRYADVLSDPEAPSATMLQFFDVPDHQRRMIESELHHDRPPLAGVIKDFEDVPEIAKFFATHDRHRTLRFRQAVGVAVLIAMESLGWRTAGRKGYVAAKWFERPERYVPA